jgi:hypothetical protein
LDILSHLNPVSKQKSFSPDLASADFKLYPRVKSASQGRRFCDAADTIQNATKELKRLSQNSFQDYFQHFYSC